MQCSFASLEQNAASLVYKDLKKYFSISEIFQVATFKVNLKQINLNIYQNHENVLLTLNQLIETHDYRQVITS